MRIYLDYNATTPAAPEVIDAVARALAENFGNPSSVHAFGQRAKAGLDEARTEVARLIDADPSAVVFTSGGTEANNLALRGVADATRASKDDRRRRIVTTGIEHEAVLTTLKTLERAGWTVDVLPVGDTGVLAPAALADRLDRADLVIGVHDGDERRVCRDPSGELAAIAHEHGALFHTDAVQSVGKIPVSVGALGVDLLSLSGHKFAGPKGTGALWIRRGVRLVAHMTGGRQERNRRAGTENVPALVGLGVAARLAHATLAVSASSIGALRARLETGILAAVPGAVVNGDRDRRVPNTSNLSFEGIEAESLLIALDLEGVAVSTGSACSSGSLEPSHVLRAMGLPSARARNSLRFSLGAGTTVEEVDFVIGILPNLVAKLRRLGQTAAALR